MRLPISILILVSLIGCTATEETGSEEATITSGSSDTTITSGSSDTSTTSRASDTSTTPIAPEPEYTPPETVPTPSVAEWAETLRKARAIIQRYVETTHGDTDPALAAIRWVVAEMRRFAAGAGISPADGDGSPDGPSTSPGPTTPGTPEDPDVQAVRNRAEAALEELGDD